MQRQQESMAQPLTHRTCCLGSTPLTRNKPDKGLMEDQVSRLHLPPHRSAPGVQCSPVLGIQTSARTTLSKEFTEWRTDWSRMALSYLQTGGGDTTACQYPPPSPQKEMLQQQDHILPGCTNALHHGTCHRWQE